MQLGATAITSIKVMLIGLLVLALLPRASAFTELLQQSPGNFASQMLEQMARQAMKEIATGITTGISNASKNAYRSITGGCNAIFPNSTLIMITSLFCLSYCFNPFKAKGTEPGEDPYSPNAPPLSLQLYTPWHSTRRPKRRAPPPPSSPTRTAGPATPLTESLRYTRGNTPSVFTCVAVLTLLLVQVSNGQDIATRDRDTGEKGQAEVQLLNNVQPDNIQGYHKGDALELTCMYFLRQAEPKT